LISDIVYEKNFVEELLKTNGIFNYSKLYLSSSLGVLKHTGKMFEYVLSDLNVNSKQILHIGDNYTSDIINAQSYNINTLYVPSVFQSMKKLEINKFKNIYNNQKLSTVHNGLIAKTMCDNPFIINEKSFINANIKNLGYSVFAPIVFSFAQWLLKDIIQNNIKEVFFLARDGFIVKKSVDILIDKFNLDISTYYIYASRRAINISSIFTLEDIIKLIELNFSTTTLEKFLRNRFGIEIDMINQNLLDIYDFEFDTQVNYTNDFKKLKKFILEKSISNLILENAQKERELLLDYFNENSLKNDNKLKALVDIGHNGSLQVGISNLLGTNLLLGYYFCTFDGIKQVFEKGMDAKGFYSNLVKSSDIKNPYIKNILMFELLFQNQDKSFLYFKKIENTIKPVFLDEYHYEDRKAFIQRLYLGVENYIKEFVPYLCSKILEQEIDAKYVVEPYIDFLENPQITDIEIFQNIYFENVFSNREYTPIINKRKPNHSVWKKGSQLFFDYEQPILKENKVNLTAISLNDKLFNLYINSGLKKPFQKLKDIPFIGKYLIKFKHTVLNWK
ncbi:MAG: HAD hydrolase-like protein, partial [Bacteroidota bacterium]|nr:HAD hydrolase-like protein [Bacteroidota bacterium]